jgi:phosphate transport system protein
MIPERQHTSTDYEQRLKELKKKLLRMGHMAESMIADSVRSYQDRHLSLAEETINRDVEMDGLEIEIDNLCYEMLVLKQPVACDLRTIATALKIVKDLERIGDIAVNIAERAQELITEPDLNWVTAIPGMAEVAQRLLKESLDAFVNSDTELAEKIIINDRALDAMYEQVFRQLLTYMLEDRRAISRAIKLIFIAKHLERVGDHSANIAEMAVFLVAGEDIRHRAAHK